MADRDEIIVLLDDLLEPATFDDHGPNGLQVPGAAEVDLVVTGVSASLELFERAAAAGAQMVLCHHGLSWDLAPRRITPRTRRRLEALFGAGMSLAAYHLPLDAHAEVGNNALLCEALGLRRGEPFGHHDGRPLGFVGRSDEGIAIEALGERIGAVLGREPLILEGGPQTVHTVGVVSGAAASMLDEAVENGLDAFLTGEPAEHAMADAREGAVHFIAAGHYATETLGVRRLGELLERRLGVRHEFIEVPNPV